MFLLHILAANALKNVYPGRWKNFDAHHSFNLYSRLIAAFGVNYVHMPLLIVAYTNIFKAL
jgi:hypothetical protein